MAPKKGDAGAGGKSKKGGAAGPEKKKISVADIVLGEDKDKKKKGGASSSSASSSSGAARAAAAMAKGKKKEADDYLAGFDLPPSDDEEDEEEAARKEAAAKKRAEAGAEEDEGEEGGKGRGKGSRGTGVVQLPAIGSLQMTDRQAKKKEKKELMMAAAVEEQKKEALREDDDSAFSVVIGAKLSSVDDAGADGAAAAADAHVKDIKLENFSVSAKGKELFRNASITIVHGRRYGLVGPNGMGKSTLMKLLAKRKLPVPRGIDVLLVEQEVVGDQRSALEAVVTADVELVRLREEEERLKALIDRIGAEEDRKGEAAGKAEGVGNGADGTPGANGAGAARKGRGGEGTEKEEEEEEGDSEEEEEGEEGEDVEMEDVGGKKLKKGQGQEKRVSRKQAKKLGKGGGKDKAGGKGGATEAAPAVVEEDEEEASAKLTAVYERMREIGAEAAEARASKILAGLGFSKEMQARATKSFSGGWRMRISLARALYIQPTLLLLDEPTNHLDLRAVLWLEEYLMRWKKTLVVVSHDRDFLNSVCTDIIHLHDFKLALYKGNFESFEEMYEQKRRENNKQFEKFEKQMKAAKASGSRTQQDKVKHAAKSREERTSKKKGKGASGGGDHDDDAPKEAPTRWRDYTVEFHFPEPTELQPPLLQLRDVAFQYPGRPDFGLKDIDVAVDMGTRVAIVGPNGAGKSTLLNLLVGDLEPTDGESRQSQKLRVGRYSQHFVDKLTMDENPVEYLLRLHPDQEGPSRQEAVRSRLGKFGLAGHNHLTPIVKLSGGQKARVVFTEISMSKPHILLLDEPTNHLDMQSIDALADALDEFSGGVVLVSHDSRLISRVCDDEERSEIWVVDAGTCKKFPGTFDDYKNQLLKEIIAEVEE